MSKTRDMTEPTFTYSDKSLDNCFCSAPAMGANEEQSVWAGVHKSASASAPLVETRAAVGGDNGHHNQIPHPALSMAHLGMSRSATADNGDAIPLVQVSAHYMLVHSSDNGTSLTLPDIGDGAMLTVKSTSSSQPMGKFDIHFPTDHHVETYCTQSVNSIRPALKVIKNGKLIMYDRRGSVTFTRTTMNNIPTWLILNHFDGNGYFVPSSMIITSDQERANIIASRQQS